MTDHSCRYELTYIDVAGRHRKEQALGTSDRSTAISEFSSIVSPHVVELWQGSKLVASRRPNEPPFVSAEWSLESVLKRLDQHLGYRSTNLLRRLLPTTHSASKVRAAA